jgi:diguanylate cyclase (GGDEF)-like protein
MAFMDSLTNLPNRRKFMAQLTAKIERREKRRRNPADLDGFKEINDTLGHAFETGHRGFAEKLSGVAKTA